MESVKLETKPSYYPWAAAVDAARRNAANAARYVNAARAQAEAMKQALSLLYAAEEIYISFRKKFISIKLCEAEVVDIDNLLWLEDGWEKLGITKYQTEQGIIYRIPAKH